MLLRQCQLAIGKCSRRAGSRFYSEKKVSSTGADAAKTEQKTDVEENKPLYATKVDYQKNVMAQRYKSADSETGQRPTAWQKRFLVITRLYKNQAEIPEVVARGTMNRMHDRMRVVYIITASLGFFSIFYIMEMFNMSRIERDRKSGVVVTKM